MAFFAIGCGDGSSSSQDAQVLANSNSAIVGVWALQKFEDEMIDPSESALLNVVDLNLAEESLLVDGQKDCSGSVNAILSRDELQLGSDQSNGCFVHFPNSVEENRSRISDSLRGGAVFSLNADSTLTLQGSTGTLVFVKAQE
jgi:hypothetical protein